MPTLHATPESKQIRLRKMLLQVPPDGQLEQMKEQTEALGGADSGEALERVDVSGGDDIRHLLLRGKFSGNARLVGFCEEFYDRREHLWTFTREQGLSRPTTPPSGRYGQQ